LTLDGKDRIDLINYRLQQVDEAIEDAELLIENKRLRAALNRIYYGMFYSLLALGLAEGFESSKHSQLLGWFNKNFVYAGKIDERFGKIVTKAYNRRTKSDYDSYITYDNEEVVQMFNEMKEFIAEVKNQVHII